jgi:hypothetical protein
MRRRTFLVSAAALAFARVVRADAQTYKVIVHPDNALDAIDRGFLRDGYLKKVIEWPRGVAMRPVDLASKFPEHQRFLSEVLRKTAAQLKNYWNQQIFSGKSVPPPEVESVAAAIEYVIANRGAIGYIPASADPRGAKVIALS